MVGRLQRVYKEEKVMRKISTWKQRIKEAGVNIHVIATGAGAGLQSQLWEVPGSSAYLSGCSFPYTG